jgi:rod shape-determining protein MreC
MKRKGNVFPVFVIFVILSGIVFVLSQNGFVRSVRGVIEHITIPLQRMTFDSFLFFHDTKTEIVQLREENAKLLTQLAKQKELEKEDQALRDQFKTTRPSSSVLLPAHVLGLVSFIPGITAIDQIVIDKGMKDNVQSGAVVIFKDNLIGVISQVSEHQSLVNVLTKKETSFTAETVKTSALGIIKGLGEGEMIIDNVAFADKLQKNDIVITKGDMHDSNKKIPPHLVIGKISSINKRESDVFQTAKVRSLIDISRLDIVFVMKQ